MTNELRPDATSAGGIQEDERYAPNRKGRLKNLFDHWGVARGTSVVMSCKDCDKIVQNCDFEYWIPWWGGFTSTHAFSAS